MRRRVVIIAGAAAMAAAAGFTLAPSAQAAEGSLCYDLDVNVAGQQLLDQAGCLPPEGGAPGVPGIPGLPELPDPGLPAPGVPGLPELPLPAIPGI